MLAITTIVIALAMAFRARNVLAAAVAFQVIRNNDQSLTRHIAAMLSEPEPRGDADPLTKLLSKRKADE